MSILEEETTWSRKLYDANGMNRMPSTVRKLLDLNEGDEFEYVLKDGEIKIRPKLD
jgi:AbrB family looped-hinge helix DNA binding protein